GPQLSSANRCAPAACQARIFEEMARGRVFLGAMGLLQPGLW
ncbi:hypothetical protein AK812_SmicGene48380, partial [Symbiodinium microadriaticum]